MSVKIIAAVGKNGELGRGGDLCFHIKEDMKFFKETTLTHAVLMGRKTWESIGRPLKERKNYVASRKELELPEGVIRVSEPEELLKEYAEKDDEELFAIGGASIYEMALPFADEIILTEIEAADEAADTFFPQFRKEDFIRTVLKKGKEDVLEYSFVSYKRK